MPNGAIGQTAFTDATLTAGSTPVKGVHFSQLRTAIDNLQALAPNVTNCGFTNFCQTCQSCQGCQTQCSQCSQCKCFIW